MNNTDDFVENGDVVHLSGAFGDGRTLCGDALEGDTRFGIGPSGRTARKTVTCRRCAAVVLHCRGVRVAPAKD